MKKLKGIISSLISIGLFIWIFDDLLDESIRLADSLEDKLEFIKKALEFTKDFDFIKFFKKILAVTD